MQFKIDQLETLIKKGELYKSLGNNKVECFACAHRCKIKNNRDGICKVRKNKDGILMVPHGYVAALHVDPIEKKPFYHAYPGSLAMSFGMLGCNLRCPYCQNWQISQTLKDPNAGVRPRLVEPGEIVNHALSTGSRSVISTYNEPLITSEWAKEIFTRSKKEGLITGFVSSGNTTPEVLDFLRPVTDLYKIDLKTFNHKSYRKLGASLESILKSITEVYRYGFWTEIVTLLVPNFNDSDDEIEQIAEFLYDLSPDIPWHLSAYHTDYKMMNRNTTLDELERAAKIGKKVGLKHIYIGNVYRGNKWRDTRCPECETVQIQRTGFQVEKYSILGDRCFNCEIKIAGKWEEPKLKRRYFDLFS